MFFRDILTLPHNRASNTLSLEVTLPLFPGTPADVVEQFYTDHGRNSRFQEAYGDLDLSALRWRRRSLAAKTIVACSVNEGFAAYVKRVGESIEVRPDGSWYSDRSTLPAAMAHWQRLRTWARLPIFIDGRLIGERSHLRLVEGHTRVGFLSGLVKQAVVAPASRHEIWFGDVA